ncbi:hypothetical protein ACG2F4_05050 [Halalkalibaculum sp. DA3122]|uniref:hypothetical protein n=1 Tax=Halalkalibaculum sp. DA3122 TaxID=3373607 RepID=UPI003754C317
MSKDKFPFQELKSLILEELNNQPQGNFRNLVGGVIELAITKGIYNGKLNSSHKFQYINQLKQHDRNSLKEATREILWQLLVQGIIIFGTDENNPSFPNYRVTSRGMKFLDDKDPQPYDPDGFLNYFKNENPSASKKVYSYLEEAVKTYNHGCLRSCAVMLGAASEAAIIELHEEFKNAISNTTKKNKFEKDSGLFISSKFRVLEDRLNKMVDAKKFPHDLKEIVTGYFSSIFHLIRRTRNSAGHPEILRDIEEDELFLNLRMFTTYQSCILKIIDHVSQNGADW